MKKAFFKYNKNSGDYYLEKNTVTNNKDLYYLACSFNPGEADILRVDVEIIPKKNKVNIYFRDSLKKQADLEFDSEQKEDDFDDAYIAYVDKRWVEIPKVELSVSDWELLQEKWNQVKNKKYQYAILILDDSGPLLKFDVYGKNELSQEDLDYIQQEHEKYLKYEKARRKYIQNHPDYSEVWRGPQDDEYEADIMKYYDENE